MSPLDLRIAIILKYEEKKTYAMRQKCCINFILFIFSYRYQFFNEENGISEFA